MAVFAVRYLDTEGLATSLDQLHPGDCPLPAEERLEWREDLISRENLKGLKPFGEVRALHPSAAPTGAPAALGQLSGRRREVAQIVSHVAFERSFFKCL